MIGEFGALERAPGERARWFEDMATALRQRFPRIHAVVYFDSDHFGSDGIEYRWKLDGSPDAERAFAMMAREPYFNPRGVPVRARR